MKKLIVGGVAAALVVVAVIGVSAFFQYSNSEIRLRNQIGAQQQSNEAVFDNTWKIIKQQAGIADQYKDAFKEIYPALMEGRYGNARGGALLSFVKESNPNFDTSLYQKLANTVEVQRTVFTREQQKLIDLNREHDNMLQQFPSSIFLMSRKQIDIIVVTSSKTEEAFKTRKEEL